MGNYALYGPVLAHLKEHRKFFTKTKPKEVT